MFGAILGDIIGSRFEFAKVKLNKNFELFAEDCRYTDDTVMTIAIADALLAAGEYTDSNTIKYFCKLKMLEWGQQYLDCGFGSRFYEWLTDNEAEAYNSYGNGSAMRVSPAGWLYDTMEETREVARATAEVTHNHPEGIKGAEATAAVIFLAREGADNESIRRYVEKEFNYSLDRTLDEIRLDYQPSVSCMETVPQAITAFLEGVSFEDTIRNAVSLGGDTDTLGAIAGAMAEARYGAPYSLITEALSRIPSPLRKVAEKMYDMLDYTEEPLDEWMQIELGRAIDCDDTRYDFGSDADEIVKIYEKYVRLDKPLAMNNLGGLYYNGRLGEPDYELALHYLTKATDMKYPLAFCNLAYCYLRGNGTEENYEKAYQLLVQGVILGDDAALIKLGDMYALGEYVSYNEAMAFECYKRGYTLKPFVKNDNIKGSAASRLGDCYYGGLGVEQDRDEALKYYKIAERKLRKACKAGDKAVEGYYKHAVEQQEAIAFVSKSEEESGCITD